MMLEGMRNNKANVSMQDFQTVEQSKREKMMSTAVSNEDQLQCMSDSEKNGIRGREVWGQRRGAVSS